MPYKNKAVAKRTVTLMHGRASKAGLIMESEMEMLDNGEVSLILAFFKGDNWVGCFIDDEWYTNYGRGGKAVPIRRGDAFFNVQY